MDEVQFIWPVVLSFLLGGVLGWQRVHWGKSAGPRTYALVTAGATLFTLMSLNAFAGDVARVAAGVVTGIGFLGAGTILHRESRVEGLTTAAGLWMAAAIGMAVGAGYYVTAIVLDVLVLIILMINEHKYVHRKKK